MTKAEEEGMRGIFERSMYKALGSLSNLGERKIDRDNIGACICRCSEYW